MDRHYRAVVLMLLMSSSALAQDHYSAQYVNRGDIAVDGVLSDWQQAGATFEPITWVSPQCPSESLRSDMDLGATFSCLFDGHKLHFAVRVTDDALVFGNEMFSCSWQDDSVEILIDGDPGDPPSFGFDENDSQIRVSLDNLGRTAVEGRTPLVQESFPYIWRALGVDAVLRPADGGYVVEASVPYRLLGWPVGAEADRFGLNIRVLDDDDGGDFDCLMGLAEDPENRSWVNTSCYTQVVVAGREHVADAQRMQRAAEQAGREISVSTVVGTPDNAETYEEIYDVLEGLVRGDLGACSVALDANRDADWHKPMLGIVQREFGQHALCALTFGDLADNSPDTGVRLWARMETGRAYMRLSEHEQAREEFRAFLRESSVRNGSMEVDGWIVGYIAESLLTQGKLEEVIELYRQRADLFPAGSLGRHRAELKVAHFLCVSGDYAAALNICDRLSVSGATQDIRDRAAAVMYGAAVEREMKERGL